MPEVEDVSHGVGRRSGGEEGVDGVVHVHAVATLQAIAVQHDVLTGQRLPNEHREEAEVLALEVLPRPVDVREPQHGDWHS